MNQKVLFQGAEYIICNGTVESEGAISTPEQYRTFSTSFAHLMPDGRIMRFNQQIGTRADLTVIGEDNTEIETLVGFEEMFDWFLKKLGGNR